MVKYIITSTFMLTVLMSMATCKERNTLENQKELPEKMITDSNSISSNKVKIKVGTSTFMVSLSDNATATAFKALLPMTIAMNELNNNEKFYDLPKNLPTNASVPTSIQSGDLMMYGSKTLVLFYETFSTSYSYTKIGQIDDTEGLTKALGTKNVTVTFE